jgi:cyclomaltodextrinase
VTILTPDWVRDAVFYEIFPDRYTRSHTVSMPGPLEPWDAPPTHAGFKGGDLVGIAERLDELADLGITALYLTPVFASASNHRYHAYDYMTVDPLLGGDAALRHLLDRAHERGMKVILDGVFNHCGRGFWPFHHILESGTASPYRNWFLLDPAVLSGEHQLNAYPDRGHSPGSGSDQLGYRAWWGMPALPKFNIDEPAVREYLLSVAEHWLRFGIDGWRLDVPAEIDDERFWQAFRRRCRAIDPEAYLVGEIWDEAPDWLRGDRFDALMNYPLGTAILGFAGGAHLDAGVIGRHDTYRRMLLPLDGPAFAGRLEHLMTNYDPAVVAVQLNLVGSHDTPRALTVLGGDRLALRLTMLLQATLPGVPCIYYGDEIGMEGDGDPDCRRAYPAGREDGDRWLRTFVQAILAARRAHVALRRGTVRVLAAEGAAVAFLREAEGRTALVALNAGVEAAGLQVPAGPADRSLALPGLAVGTVEAVAGMATAGPIGTGAPSTWTLRLPPQGALVLVEP